MSRQVIHLGTVIATQFGVLDDAGNVIEQWNAGQEGGKPFEAKVFTKESFAEVFDKINEVRKELTAQKNPPAPPDPLAELRTDLAEIKRRVALPPNGQPEAVAAKE